MSEKKSVDAVILAAGYSSRANGFKMQFIMEEKAVLQHVVEVFLPICANIFVVGGYQYEKLIPLIQPYQERVTLIQNENFEKGMFSSVKTGVARVVSDQFFITPGDCPLITKEVCQILLDSKKEFVIPSFHQKGGHPVLLPFSCIKELLKEPDESNLKEFLKRQPTQYVSVHEEGILYDLDTRKDYKKIKERIKEKYRR